MGIDRFKDGTTAVGQFPEVAEPLLQVTKLRVVQRPGGFLAVPGDERNRRAAVEQANCCLHLPGFHAKLGSDLGVDRVLPRCAGGEGSGGRCRLLGHLNILPYRPSRLHRRRWRRERSRAGRYSVGAIKVL